MENKQEELLTITEMAHVLKVNTNWLYSRTKLGQTAIPHIRIGKHIRFRKDEVLEFFAHKQPDV